MPLIMLRGRTMAKYLIMAGQQRMEFVVGVEELARRDRHELHVGMSIFTSTIYNAKLGHDRSMPFIHVSGGVVVASSESYIYHSDRRYSPNCFSTARIEHIDTSYSMSL